MARRKQVQVPATPSDGVPVMPLGLTFRDPSERPDSAAWHAAQRAWLRARGIDPADWGAFYPVLITSKRAHARTSTELPALDRARLRSQA